MFHAVLIQRFNTYWGVKVENHRRQTEWDRESVAYDSFYKQFVGDLDTGVYDSLMRAMKQGIVIKPTDIILANEWVQDVVKAAAAYINVSIHLCLWLFVLLMTAS